MASFSFIIPVKDGERYISECLRRISGEMTTGDEIIIADNGSTDATLDIARRFDRVTILNHPHITIAALRNRGAERARGDIFAFIDVDCFVCPGWRRAAEEVLADPAVDGTGSHFDVSLEPTWIEKAWIPPRPKTAQPVHYLPSGNLVIRKLVYEKIGGFDERLVTDEDTEIGHRLKRHGYRLVDAPGVCVKHQGNARSLGQFIRKEKWHATSILSSMKAQKLDKPMVMTIAFLVFALLFLVAWPLSSVIPVSPWWFLAGLVAVPGLTAFYRAATFGIYKYLPQLFVLFGVFYFVRALTIIESLFGRTKRRA